MLNVIFFSHFRGVDEIIQLSLQETYCLSVLLYASPALCLKPKQLSKLKVCWNSICRNIFNFSVRELVKLFIRGLGRLDLSRVIMLRRVSLYNHLSITDNSILAGLFQSYLHDYFNIDNCLNSLAYLSHTLLVKRVFMNYSMGYR